MAREVEAEAAGVQVLLRDRGAEVSIKNTNTIAKSMLSAYLMHILVLLRLTSVATTLIPSWEMRQRENPGTRKTLPRAFFLYFLD